ncbi:MAG: hypothetical protein LBD31_06510 [Treponema sp.]|nr:hypothetical protein [Treponema sp.]
MKDEIETGEIKINDNKKVCGLFLAPCFLLIVFVIAAASLKQTLHTINETPFEAKSFKTAAQSTKGNIDGIYRDMLDFVSPFPVNRGTYIELHGLLARLMGQRTMNQITKLNNGHLTWTPSNSRTDPSVSAFAASAVTRFKDFCEGRNIPFLYIQAPFHLCGQDRQLPAEMASFTNEEMDAFAVQLREAGVEVMDLHRLLHEDGMDHYRAFFKTDHHWTPETGFWAAGKILRGLTERGILQEPDPALVDMANYHIEVFSGIFMGSHAWRTGAAFGGVDDISLIYPKFETALRLSGNGVDRRGSFKEVMFGMDRMKRGFQQNPYAVYPVHGDGILHFNNPAAKNKKTILFASDSFGLVCTPFVSLSVEHVFWYYSDSYHWDTVIDAVTALNPDGVVILLNLAGARGTPLQNLAKTMDQYAE